MSDEHADGYGLVVPFVAVASVGGPYDDASYVAGYNAGVLDGQLSGWTLPRPDRPMPPLPIDTRWVETENVAQMDLIAMKHGWRLEAGETYESYTAIKLMTPDVGSKDDGPDS